MNQKFVFAAAIFAMAIGLPGATFAGANDYAFEPVNAEVKQGNNVTVAVRLIHKATRKPVTDAVIVQTRIDMGPDGMGAMVSKLTPLPSTEPGVYAFKTELAMAGRWQLSLAAKVQGEPETVIGKITFKASK